MRLWGFLAAMLAFCAGVTMAAAQDRAWIQVEAQPTLGKAVERAEAWAGVFPDVAAYETRTGWTAIVLGPYDPAEAAGRLNQLRENNMIPPDAFLSDGAGYGAQVWAADGAAMDLPDPAAPDPAAGSLAPEEPAATDEPLMAEDPLDESPAEARASEALLLPEERIALQQALAWYGFYQGGMDGAFGKGTRASMAAWQEANGYEPTGILTSRQRAVLVGNHGADQAEFGFSTLAVAEAGIEVTLPLSLVEFKGYEPPFIRYDPVNGSGLTILLISEPGGAEALSGLYDILQTLESVPPGGERSKGADSFTISAEGNGVQSLAYAATARGMVKGYLAIWNPADADRMERILPVLKSSFRPVGDKALDPGLVPMEDAVRTGLLAGLEVRRPKMSRSGFFVDAKGTVATVAEAVDHCARITIDHDTEATVTLSDAATGLALITPRGLLAPPAVAALATASPAPGTELAVAGYSYEDKLPAPVLTFGVFDEAAGLAGETGLVRLSAPVLDGDRGGPVVDPSGAVVGLLIPGGAPEGKELPRGVAFAADAPALAAFLARGGVTPATAAATAAVTPDALNSAALGMTVLVSCWE
jgi:S1-C subfamily serine protease